MNGCARGVALRPVEEVLEVLRRLGEVGLQDDPGARAFGELGLAQDFQCELRDRLARVVGLHVDVQVRAGVAGDAQQAAQARLGAGDPALGRGGAQQRREGGDLDAEVDARDRAGGVALEQLARGPGRRGGRDGAQRVLAALRVGVGLLLGDRRLAEQVDRGGGAGLPEPLDLRERVVRVGADDEALGHLPDAERRGGGDGAPGQAAGRERRAAGGERRGGRGLGEQLAEVAGEVLGRVARGADVDEAEDRGAQLGVVDHRGHHAALDGGAGRAARGRHRGDQGAADLRDARLDRGGRRRVAEGRLLVGVHEHG